MSACYRLSKLNRNQKVNSKTQVPMGRVLRVLARQLCQHGTCGTQKGPLLLAMACNKSFHPSFSLSSGFKPFCMPAVVKTIAFALSALKE